MEMLSIVALSAMFISIIFEWLTSMVTMGRGEQLAKHVRYDVFHSFLCKL